MRFFNSDVQEQGKNRAEQANDDFAASAHDPGGTLANVLSGRITYPVLAGLGPAIHEKPLVDPRTKPGEDELGVIEP